MSISNYIDFARVYKHKLLCDQSHFTTTTHSQLSIAHFATTTQSQLSIAHVVFLERETQVTPVHHCIVCRGATACLLLYYYKGDLTNLCHFTVAKQESTLTILHFLYTDQYYLHLCAPNNLRVPNYLPARNDSHGIAKLDTICTIYVILLHFLT